MIKVITSIRHLGCLMCLGIFALSTIATSAEDPLTIGLQQYDKKHYKAAIAYFKDAAARNSSRAKLMLAWCYYKGEGCDVSLKKAFDIYWALANSKVDHNTKADIAAAQYNLALFYYRGHGVKKDIDKAKKWLTKAAGNGDQDAKDFLDKYL